VTVSVGASSPAKANASTVPNISSWKPPTWDEVVREHGDRVYRLAYRLTGNAHDAEDLTQDVFIRVFRSLDGYTPGTFEGWLHRITTNLFLDRMRRAARIRFEGLPEDAERLPGRDPSPEAALMADEFDPDVERALASLPPDFRAAVVLCDIEQLSYEEIAATLNVKLGTVRSRISRGRAMLRAALDHRAPDRAVDPVSAPTPTPVAPRAAAPTAGCVPDIGQDPAGEAPGEHVDTPVAAR
jgi:RNA polymerase sigma-70 factor (ECF subfamily)